jgi:hypothetical protein
VNLVTLGSQSAIKMRITKKQKNANQEPLSLALPYLGKKSKFMVSVLFEYQSDADFTKSLDE